MKEFTLTCTERPELLEESLSTFTDVLQDVDTKKQGRIYANVDPVPYNDDDVQREVLNIISFYFNETKFRIGPEGGCFAEAINWVMMQPENKYFFHLEDDWRFHSGTINWERYKSRIQEMKNCLQCTSRSNPGGQRLHFPPNMMKTDMIQRVIEKHPVPRDENPEQWLIARCEEVLGDYSVACDPDVDRDHLGRDWLDEMNIGKEAPERGSRGPGDWVKWDLSEFDS